MPTLANPDTGEGYEVSFVTVTPEMSQKWLDEGLLDGNYRRFKEMGSARYAHDVRNGDWHFTGDTVKINTDGKRRVVDGQHRLSLPRLTGVPLTFLFVEGPFDGEAEDIMDTGMIRSLKDVLIKMGEGPSFAAGLSSMITAANRFQKDPKRGIIRISKQVTRADQLRTLSEKPYLRDGVNVCERVRANSGLVPLSVRGAWIHIYETDPEDCSVYFERLAEPIGRFQSESPGDPIHRLRLAADNNKKRNGTIDQGYWARMIVKSWNLWRSGGETRVLSVKGSERICAI